MHAPNNRVFSNYTRQKLTEKKKKKMDPALELETSTLYPQKWIYRQEMRKGTGGPTTSPIRGL